MLRANIPVILLGHVVRYIEVDLESPPKTLKTYEEGVLRQKGDTYEVPVHIAPAERAEKAEIVYAGDKGKESLVRAQQVAPTRPIPAKE